MNDFSKMKRDPNKTWSSSFIQHEHRDRLQEWLFTQEDVPRPILGPDQLEELNHAMHQHLQDHQPVTISYYQNKRIQQLRGILHRCDIQMRILIMYDSNYETVQLKLNNIISITA